MLSLNEPVIRAFLLPLAVSALSVLALRTLFGEGRGAVLASAAVGLGIIAGLLAVFGLSASELLVKMQWLVLGALILGALCDRFPDHIALSPLLYVAWPIAAVLWLIAPELSAGTAGDAVIRLGGLLIGAVLLFVRLDQDQDHGARAPFLLLWCAVAMGGIAMGYDLPRVAEIAAIAVASLAGYLAWNMLTMRYPIGHAALLPAGTVLVAMVTILLALRAAAGLALLPVFALLFADRFSRRTSPHLVAAGLAALATVVAFLTAG